MSLNRLTAAVDGMEEVMRLYKTIKIEDPKARIDARWKIRDRLDQYVNRLMED